MHLQDRVVPCMLVLLGATMEMHVDALPGLRRDKLKCKAQAPGPRRSLSQAQPARRVSVPRTYVMPVSRKLSV